VGGGADVRFALAELPPRQRAVVVLRYYEDLPESQIADVLGISQGTVKSQAHKAMRNLRILLPDLAPALTRERGES
jgi:RNA polymerase sigma factor (sigma-70 family)